MKGRGIVALVLTLFAFMATEAKCQNLNTPTYASDDPMAVRTAKADPFCQDMLGLMSHGLNGFKEFKGAYRTDTDEWVAIDLMPGAEKCSIKNWDNLGTEYYCTWNVASTADANKMGYLLARRLRWCAWYALSYETGDVGWDPNARFEHRMQTHENGMDYTYKIRTYSGRQAEVELGLTVKKNPDPKESMPDEMVPILK